MKHRIRPALWFDNNLEEALEFYQSVFHDFELYEKSYAPETSMNPPGTLLIASFRLNGQDFSAITGGPFFKFNEAVSFEILVDTQEEVDYYWTRLTDGGEESACGWLKDKFGLSWQVVPQVLFDLMNDPDRARATRAMNAMLQMQKIDIAEMVAAADRDA